MPSVMAPATDPAVIKRLAHLPQALGSHRPLGLVELEAGRLPRQAEEVDQLARLAMGEKSVKRYVRDMFAELDAHDLMCLSN